MKIFFWTLLFLFHLYSLGSEETSSLSQQAEALWEARDYASASKIYEELLSSSPLDWQQARLSYNLGTIQLSRHQPLEALAFFQKITPLKLSLPSFGRNLFINEGIAYLQYAETLASAGAPLDQQAPFIEQSLRAFEQAQILDCQVQNAEQNKNPPFSCETSLFLDQWIKAARLKLDAVYQQKSQNWIEQADASSLAAFLIQQLQQWMNRFSTFQIEKRPSPDQASWLAYFQEQAESLVPLWKALQQKDFSLDQKTAVDKSLTSFLSAMQKLKQPHFADALKDWEEAIEGLKLVAFQDLADMRHAILNYQILLLQNSPSISSLKNLLAEFESLKEGNAESASIKEIKHSLRLSLKAQQNHQPLPARFFLLAGFSPTLSLLPAEKKSPASLLQQGIDQANRALQLFFLFEMLPKEASQSFPVNQILGEQQQEILTNTAPFIPTVLKEQEKLFQQGGENNSNCQQIPWNQAIPLYDQGYRALQRSLKVLESPSFDSPLIIALTDQAIKDWQQALKLILHPPQPQSAGSTSQQFANTVRLLQEMYLQDQSHPAQANQEVHSW